MRIYAPQPRTSLSPHLPNEVTMSEKAIIQVTRKHSMFHMMRAMNIFIDGKKITTVDNNETIKITVFTGTHEVYVTLESYTTEPVSVTVENDQVAALVCGVREGKSGFMAGMFNKEDYLYLRLEQEAEE